MTDIFAETIRHDPRGKVRTKLPAGMTGWAFFSKGGEESGTHRHILGRYWGEFDEHGLEPYALWIGLNPSTAGQAVNDPTVSREIAYTRDMLGFQCYLKCNVADYRATFPEDLRKPGVVPCGADNLGWIVSHAELAEKVIACWGALHPSLQYLADNVVAALEAKGIDLWCLGTTKHGAHPRHPLYVRGDTPLVRYRHPKLVGAA